MAALALSQKHVCVYGQVNLDRKKVSRFPRGYPPRPRGIFYDKPHSKRCNLRMHMRQGVVVFCGVVILA